LNIRHDIIGKLTSVVYSPNLKTNIGMAYMKFPFDKMKQEL